MSVVVVIILKISGHSAQIVRIVLVDGHQHYLANKQPLNDIIAVAYALWLPLLINGGT